MLGLILIEANVVESSPEIGPVDIIEPWYRYGHLSVPIWLSIDMVVNRYQHSQFLEWTRSANHSRIQKMLRIKTPFTDHPPSTHDC